MPIKPLHCVYGKWVIPQRYVLCIMTFLAILLSYTMRVCLHIAITEMVVAKAPSNNTQGHIDGECPGVAEENVVQGGTYDWSEAEQGFILSAFFPGYVITHIPGGLLADVYGGKHVISGGIALSALFTLLTPLTCEYGNWYSVAVIRVLMGFCQGPLYPTASTLLAKWAPPREQSVLGAFVNTGNQLGTIAGNLITSQIMARVSWPAAFYFWGIISLVWYGLFLILCYSEPAQHPFISQEEAEMLEREIGVPEKLKVPWKAILLYPTTWALVLGQIGHDLIFLLTVVQLPKYFKSVLKFNIELNGALSSLPFLLLWICSVISGYIADVGIKKGWFAVLRVRQIYTFIGNVGPGIGVILASYMGCNKFLSAFMFNIGMLVMGPFYPGVKVNVLDVTKNFAGVLMALVNGIASAAYMPVPYITGLIASNNTVGEWRAIFWVLFIICTITTVLYMFITTTIRAKWDTEDSESRS